MADDGNIAADRTTLAAVDRLLRSRLVSASGIAQVLDEPIRYAEEFLDLYRIMAAGDRQLVLPIFDEPHYLSTNPDVGAHGLDPLTHFLTMGVAERRSPHPLIDLRFMMSARPDLFPAGMNLRDLIAAIERNLCDPGPYFSIAEYSAAVPEGLPPGSSALLHFLSVGAAQGIGPNDLLDPEYYASRYDDVPEGGLAVILHFVKIGDELARQPSARFDPAWYRAYYGDVGDAAPLLHFLAVGRAGGRKPRGSELDDGAAPSGEPAAEPWLVRENGPEILARYGGLVRRLSALADERRARFVTRDVRPVFLDDPEEEAARLSFPAVAAPKVDILIPCFNAFEHTVECLASIARAEIALPYRVILADDASTDPRMAALSQVANLVFLAGAENRHFLRNCNAAFGSVSAEYLLLLNNDAQLMPGCLDALARVLDDDAGAAAAAPMILYPNGRLQEAGCAIRSDGSSIMVGVGEDPADPRYNFRRPVHYASGACLMVRRSAVGEALFDERYAPAYCEDMDLCTRLREGGHSIVYEPAAKAVHHLSASTGREANHRRLQLIMRNEAKYVDRWADRLAQDTKVRVLSFYLPQFHPVPENDRWWGKGFTEWTNAARARPSFRGHYQPHLPADLGFYDLRLAAVMGQQQRLARRYGIEGFIVYYYNFAGRRILEAPMENLLADKGIDFRFALCWANENWTRHWDGGNRSILLEQSYDPATIDSVADDAVRFAADPRALTVGGKPLFLIYRPFLIPDILDVASRLRRRFVEAGFAGVHLVYVESMELVSRRIRPADLGFDAAVEFPPQGIGKPYTGPLHVTKQGFDGHVHDYEGTVINALSRDGVGYQRYPTVFASWDNTARQPLTGTTLHGATPELFQAYVEGKLDEVENFSIGDERLLFVNAWNEWAEGAHLEPDQAYGHRWLAAIRHALVRKGMFG